ncbi:MAG TPA: putative metalloprotease CJM1_0395 family protein [Arenibaculum sp.]|nr:putative metalloprotease CJM1_0395 family protein [Arenibaculum sp.]
MFGAGAPHQLLTAVRSAAVPPVAPARAMGEGGNGPANRNDAAPGRERSEDRFGPAVTLAVRSAGTGSNSGQSGELPPEEQKMVEELRARDREVRTHEMAHLSAGGQYASGPSYTYQMGPDGRRYAIGGEVQIDTSPEKDPEATIRKMEIVKRAAMAPAEPSAQDVKVAQLADRQLNEARREVSRQRSEEMQAGGQADGQADEEVERPGRHSGVSRHAAAVSAYDGASRLFVQAIGVGAGPGERANGLF